MLSSTTNKNDYTGNGTTGTYAYSFKIFDETELLLTIADADGVETELTITTDYTVTGVGETSGGDIVLVDDSQEWIDESGYLADGYKLNIKRQLPLTQSADIRNQGDFYPEAHENVFDRLVMLIQQMQEQIDRSFKMPITSGATLDLPSPVDGNILMWDGTSGTMVNVPFDGDALLVAISEAEAAQAAAEVAQGLSEDAKDAAVVAQGLAEDAQSAAEAARDQILDWGVIIQTAYNSTVAAGTGTVDAVIPFDSTKPQNTEGSEVLTCAITPTDANNYLEIEALVNFSVEAGKYGVMALFQDTTADALAATAFAGATSSGIDGVVLKFRMLAGTTSETTFKIRAGLNTTGTLYWNQTGAGNFTLGGIMVSSLMIREIQA
jgi:hypothetical protein